MAKKSSISFIELHLEKGLLGLTVAFMVFMVVRYLVFEPNKVEFDGQRLGPRELDEALVRKADELSRAVQQAAPEKPDVPEYARQLEESVKGGLFRALDGDSPPLPQVLTVAPRFGQPLPGIEEGMEIDDVVVVTPLPPVSVVAETGISLAYRRSPPLLTGALDAEPAEATDEEDEPVELSWVTVSGYFSLEEQQAAMMDSGYAGYRAKPYLVGVEAQRQEITASGEFSEWVDVAPAKAIPRVNVPVPEFDEKGQLANQADLDAAFDTIRRLQPDIMQPTFYAVEAGDEWTIPPLPGYEAGVEEEEAEPVEAAAEVGPSRAVTRAPRAAPPPAPAGGRTSRGGLRGAGANPFVRQPQATPKTDGRKEILDDLRAARKAARDKDWDEAARLANAIINNSSARSTDRAAARKIVRDAEKARAQEEKRAAGRGARSTGVPTPVRVPFVTSPESEQEPAVWFHDDSVEPGKTYRYRLRVALWNRYVGRPAALRDPTQANQSVLRGEWSAPTAPITVAPKQRFFVRGPVFGEPAATVEVYAWHQGYWLKQDFKVRVGDAIGGPVETRTPELGEDDRPKRQEIDFSTGAVVLDLRFDEPVMLRRTTDRGDFSYREAKSLVLVYVDSADGQVKERVAELDRADPAYRRLKDEWDSVREGL